MGKYEMIPKDTVLIAWNTLRDGKLNRNIELKVFLWNEEEIKKYDRLPRRDDPYYSYAATTGSCCYGWNELTLDKLTCKCWQILLNCPSLDHKQTLMEFSKIEELQALREMCFWAYFAYEYDGNYPRYLDYYFEKSAINREVE